MKPEAILNSAFNGHSMVAPLQRVLVCSPQNSGWNDPVRAGRWRELGYHHAPDCALAQMQHEAMCRELQAVGAELVNLQTQPELSLDAVYAHDSALPTDWGIIIMRPGKANRLAEGACQRELYEQMGIPILGEVTAPGTSEAGDIVWLNRETLLIGRSYRTNASGVEQIRAMLKPQSVEVLSAPLPHAAGPSTCLHLMSLMSVLDDNVVIVDLPWLAVETVELLSSRGFRFVEIDATERDTLACNVLSLGHRRLLALEENESTNQRLRQAGFDVRTFPGSELCINGSGGPTCLTRPFLRG
ncbi:MAG TPA: arginine deiminase family protein [Terriglobales bacterium]|nr:arginine deiminase family protein [Terriglobales bacterium]